MVQYTVTPWRSRNELLKVKDQFCRDGTIKPQQTPKPEQSDAWRRKRKEQHRAIARVSLWMQRGNCPHMVDSTALLMAAVLCDEELQAGDEKSATAAMALRATYGLAFSRFVTGLLDGQQDKARKQSMYALAKGIGLPATFVELRHQCTHEQLPSLAKLREAAHKALDYIWNHYWKQLEGSSPASNVEESAASEEDPCQAVVVRYLKEFNEAKRKDLVGEMRSRWDLEELLRAIEGSRRLLPGNMAFVKAKQLAQELKELKEKDDNSGTLAMDGDTGDKGAEAGESASTANRPWQIAEQWQPTPIGCRI